MRTLTFLLLLCFVSISCKKESPVESNLSSTNPVVRILSPQANSSILDSTVIQVNATDDKGIVKVEIYIDNFTDSNKTFYVPPYNYSWITRHLPDSTTHSIYAKAYDGDGNTSSSEVLLVKIYRFLAPSNLQIVPISCTEAQLTWIDNSSAEKGFQVWRKINEGSFQQVASVGYNNISYNDITLDSTKSYTYQVRAYYDSTFTAFSSPIKASFSILGGFIRTINTPYGFGFVFTNDSRSIISGDQDSRISVYQISNGATISTSSYCHCIADSFHGLIDHLALSPDGSIIASSGGEGWVNLGSVSSGALIWKFAPLSHGSPISFNPNGQSIAALDSDTNAIRIYSTTDGSVLKTIYVYAVNNYISSSMSYSPDGQLLALDAPFADFISVVRVQDGSIKGYLANGSGIITSLSFSVDGEWLLTSHNKMNFSGIENAINIWNVNTMSEVRKIPSDSAVFGVALHPNKKVIAGILDGGTIKFWTTNSGTLIKSISVNYNLDFSGNPIAFSPDGTILAVRAIKHGGMDIDLYDARNGWVVIE